MTKKTAGIILSTAFVMPGAQTYSEYINYMDRSEAVRTANHGKYNAFESNDAFNSIEGSDEKNFEQYNDYMSNPDKTSALFTETYDHAPVEVVRHMKDYFTDARMSGSPLWQHVFSFHNEWLVEHGIMSSTTGEVDTHQLYAATRSAIKELEKREGLQGKWTGAVHYNTQHIHVHVGYTEAVSTRALHQYSNSKNQEPKLERKGKFLKKNIQATRRKFVNELLEMDHLLERTSVEFKNIIEQAKHNSTYFLENRYATLFQNLYEALPDNRSRWKYGYAKGQKFQKELDQIVRLYLNTEAVEEVKSLEKILAPLSEEYEKAYGNPKNKPTYADNKLYGKDGLYHKLGNVVLDQVRNYDKKQRKKLGNVINVTDLDQLRLEEAVVKSDLLEPEIIVDVEIHHENMEQYQEIYYENLLQVEQPLVEDLELYEPPEFEDFSSSSFFKVMKETHQTDSLQQALKKLGAHFENNKDRYSQRTADELIKVELEKRVGVIEKRGVLIESVDESGETKSKLFSSIHNKKLDQEIFMDKSNEGHGELKDDISYQSANTIVRNAKSGKYGNLKHNLDHFSKNNRKSILLQNPEATFVLGSAQWRLKNREVLPESKGIEISKPKIVDGTIVGFINMKVYDVSDTVPLQKNPFYFHSSSKKTSGNQKQGKQMIGGSKKTDILTDIQKDLYIARRLMKKTTQDYLNEQIHNKLEYDLEHK